MIDSSFVVVLETVFSLTVVIVVLEDVVRAEVP